MGRDAAAARAAPSRLRDLRLRAHSHVPLARIDTPEADVDWIKLKSAQVYHFHNHVNGAPEELTDAQGRVAWQGRYTAWGNLALQAYPLEEPDPTGLGQHLLPQNLRLQGQYADAETGLHYNTFRYYDPDIGRFITPDPIGLAGGSTYMGLRPMRILGLILGGGTARKYIEE